MSRTTRPAKYVHPENKDLQWSGFGKVPLWLEHAMTVTGNPLEAFAIVPQVQQASAVTVTKTSVINQVELFGIPSIPKKRGRPVTGQALTAAQRKRLSRERAMTGIYGGGQEGGLPLSESPLTSLLEAYSYSMSRDHYGMAQMIAQELLRRSQPALNP